MSAFPVAIQRGKGVRVIAGNASGQHLAQQGLALPVTLVRIVFIALCTAISGAERTSLLLPRNSLLVRNNSLFLLLGNFELNSAPRVQIGVSEVAGGRNFGEFPVKFPVSRETGAEQAMICTATPAKF